LKQCGSDTPVRFEWMGLLIDRDSFTPPELSSLVQTSH
jgi:hypothetical protein